MIRDFFIVKLLKNLFNYLFSSKLPETLHTTGFEIGKQTTFICGKCGIPFEASSWIDVNLDIKNPLNNQHLISSYFKVLKHTHFYRGVVMRPQIHYYTSIRDRFGDLMSCNHCQGTHYQNILLMKVLDINVAVVL